MYNHAKTKSKQRRYSAVEKRPLNIPISKTLTSILSLLKSNGMSGLIVGGAVRDAVQGIKPKDIDVEVYGASYQQLVELLGHYGKLDLVGKSFGVIKFADSEGNDYDFSIPRRDNKTGIGHKDFTSTFDPTINPQEAAARRDFTINSLAYDPLTSDLHDYYNGREDLENGVLRATSPAFAEDPLRVLRGMQFISRFGMSIDPATAEMAKSIAHEYPTIPKERIAEEWMKFAMKSKYPSKVFDYLQKTGWIQHYPELAEMMGKTQNPAWYEDGNIEGKVGVPQDSQYHPEGNVHTHTGHVMNAGVNIADREGLTGDDRAVLGFATLLHDVAKPYTTAREVKNGEMHITSKGHEPAGGTYARKFLESIGIKPSIIAKVVPLIENHLAHMNFANPEASHKTIRKLAQRLFPANVKELTHVIEADHSGRPPLPQGLPTQAQRMYDLAIQNNVDQKPQEKLIQGRDLIQRGFNPGPQIGHYVNTAYEAQNSAEFSTKPEADQWLDNHLSQEKNTE